MTEAASDGWLLHLSGGLRAAIGLRQMLYILPDEPATHAVPRAPVHATRIFVWQQHLVPLIDLHAYLSGSKAQPGADASSWQPMVGVVGCATGSETEDSAAQGAALGALMLSRAPDRIQVSDSQACGLPDELAAWAPIAMSCFRHPLHGPVPILDLPAILERP
jgi:hypothetical protein